MLNKSKSAMTIFLVSLAFIVVSGILVLWFFLPQFFETPEYDVLEKSGNFEVRVYPKMLIASIQKEGSRDLALRQSFPYLANYISGKYRKGPKISMTVPVVQARLDHKESWKVFFIMPKEYLLKNMPSPNTDSIKLKELKELKVAVIQFSGPWTDKNFNEKIQLLNNWLLLKKLSGPLNIMYAFYNGPTTPSFLRRNEILMEIN